MYEPAKRLGAFLLGISAGQDLDMLELPKVVHPQATLRFVSASAGSPFDELQHPDQERFLGGENSKSIVFDYDPGPTPLNVELRHPEISKKFYTFPEPEPEPEPEPKPEAEPEPEKKNWFWLKSLAAVAIGYLVLRRLRSGSPSSYKRDPRQDNNPYQAPGTLD